MADVVQTAITAEPSAGYPGLIYDTGPKDVVSCVAQEDIPFGAYVRVSGGYCELADDAAEVTDGEGGVALATPTRPSGLGHKQGDVVPVMLQGRVWVATEQAIAAQATPFVRFAGEGTKGGWRNDADDASAAQPSGVSVYRGVGAAGLAVLQLNYPGRPNGA